MEAHPVQFVFAAILLVGATVAHSRRWNFSASPVPAHAQDDQGLQYVRSTLAVAFIVIALLIVHLAEVFVWAIYYEAKGCVPDFATGVYFSMTTYSTLGYGDVVLQNSWRILAGVESLVGLLMIGWSTALLIRAVSWVKTRLLNHWGLKVPE